MKLNELMTTVVMLPEMVDRQRPVMTKLFEAQNYDEMFNFFDKYMAELKKDTALAPANVSTPYSMITSARQVNVEWAKETLKRKDRIVWFLRAAKFNLLNNLASLPYNSKETSEMLKREMDRTPPPAGPTQMTFNELKSFLSHMISLPVPSIQNYVFDKQTIDEVSQKLREYETVWKDKTDGTIPYDPEATIFLKVSKDFEWVDLEEGYSKEEACAMGHCGNEAGKFNKDHNILSLRQVVEVDGEKLWRVCLTFIWNKATGMLGEMKGRGNDKPAAHYHEYIIPLILDPRIKGIVGGGYKPQNNFSVFDLGETEAHKLIKEKPTLATIGEYLKHFGMDEFMQKRLKDMLPLDKYPLEKDCIKVKFADNLEDFAKEVKGDRDANWLLDLLTYHNTLNWNEYVPDTSDIAHNFDKANEAEFIKRAKKKYGDVEDANMDSLRDILDFMKEQEESDYDIVIECHRWAEESSILSEMFDYFKDAITEKWTTTVTADIIEASGSESSRDVGEMKCALTNENFDEPFYVLVQIDEFLEYLSENCDDFVKIVGIQATPQFKFEEPRYGFSGDGKVYDADFNMHIKDRMNEIFPAD